MATYRTATTQPVRTLSITFFLTATSLALACTLSGQALVNFGVNYALGGDPFQKVHPATYLALFSVLGLYFFSGHPIKRLLFVESPAVSYFSVALLLLVVYSATSLQIPMTILPDTWLLAICVFILCTLLTGFELKALARLLDVFFLVNSSLGIFEVAFNKHLVAITVANATLGVMEFPYEWRAGAFLGHPLTNAYLTGAYILLLLTTPRVRTLGIRIAMMLICGLSMFAFGSRAATVLTGVFAFGYIAYKMMQGITTGRLEKAIMVYAAMIVGLSVTVVPVVLASGFADRFIERFSVDNGSAMARSGAIDMISNLSWSDLMLGTPLTTTMALGTQYTIGAGVESFFLGFLMNYGVLGCIIFWPPLFYFCRSIYLRTSGECAYVLIYFFLCCATSVSLSSKILSLGILTAMCFTSVDPRTSPLANIRRAYSARRTGPKSTAARLA